MLIKIQEFTRRGRKNGLKSNETFHRKTLWHCASVLHQGLFSVLRGLAKICVLNVQYDWVSPGVAAIYTIPPRRQADGFPVRGWLHLKNHWHRIERNPKPWSGSQRKGAINQPFCFECNTKRTSSNLLCRSARRRPEYTNVWPHRGSHVLASVFVRRFDLSEPGSKKI